MTTAYLDHAASTPMRPEVASAMARAATDGFANPSASHRSGRVARRLLDDARDQVAEVVGAEPGEVVFTSGGTEADNLAVDGVVRAIGDGPAWCLATDHHAVIEPVLAAGGHTLPVHATGQIDLIALAEALASGCAANHNRLGRPLVSMALANNEVGTIQPLAQAAAVVRAVAPHALIHVDAVAAAAWLDLPAHTGAADLISISGHKVGGPKGIGALIVRAGCPIDPVLRGGGQERERRSGTPNVAGAVGFAAALVATVADRESMARRVTALRDRLETRLLTAVPGLTLTGSARTGASSRADGRTIGIPIATRLPNIVNVCIPGVDSEALLFLLDDAGVAASAASSCASGAMEPSHVLAAMGVPAKLGRGSLRLSLGWCSTDAEVDHVLAVLPAAVARLRGGGEGPGADSFASHRGTGDRHGLDAGAPIAPRRAATAAGVRR